MVSKVTTAAGVEYSPGLEGVVAGETAICEVTAAGTLVYRGYDIHRLATTAPFEDVAALLIEGALPDAPGRDRVRTALAEAGAGLPGAIRVALPLMPPGAHPMDVLRTGVSMLAAFDPDLDDPSHAANVRKALRLVGYGPALLEVVGSADGVPGSGKGESFAARLLRAITGSVPADWAVRAMDVVLALYAEHEFNAGTFAARVTASTMSDMYSAVVSAIGTLKGPLHGGANEKAMDVLREVGSADKADAWVAAALARKAKIMGFGHRVYRTGDSRVPIMRHVARELGTRTNQPQWAEICEALEAAVAREKGLCANVDLYAAPVLHMLGVPATMNTPVFACARMAGWCAHVIEQHDGNRLIRPRSVYVGPVREARV
ncbi:MAG: citrate/2-methylcitrate synthase [Phycisphaerae bacterium]|nr:citrate/2-methylcitrate synthase [Tepidisphaeraceae bacterium]